jgi:hypothetical protein
MLAGGSMHLINEVKLQALNAANIENDAWGLRKSDSMELPSSIGRVP